MEQPLIEKYLFKILGSVRVFYNNGGVGNVVAFVLPNFFGNDKHVPVGQYSYPIYIFCFV